MEGGDTHQQVIRWWAAPGWWLREPLLPHGEAEQHPASCCDSAATPNLLQVTVLTPSVTTAMVEEPLSQKAHRVLDTVLGGHSADIS